MSASTMSPIVELPRFAATAAWADRIIHAGLVYQMDGSVCRAIAVRNGEIVALATHPDELEGLIGPHTLVTEARDLTLLPAFCDAHEHLIEAAKNEARVPVGDAHSIADFLTLVRTAVAAARGDEWVLTAMAWHESQLAERRLPTRAELDSASPTRPMLARRGGHLAVANSAALAATGVTASTPDPPGGSIGRDGAGEPNGVLEGSEVYRVFALVPAPSRETLVDGLRVASAQYAALGVGAIREAMISVPELGAYQTASESGRLSVRARPMIRVPDNIGVDAAVSLVEGLGMHSGFGNDWLRVWGLKFVLDGGVEGGALEQPYANDATRVGHLIWDVDEMFAVCRAGVAQGWRIATHAAGDRALRAALDVYERVIADAGGLDPGTLVIEHALLSDQAQRARAVQLGVPVTVQHALLWNMASEMLTTWGPERTARVNPIDDWLAEGAVLAAGTDMARPFNPLTNVWGMVTRGTRAAGIQGRDHAIDRATALELSTVGGARLDREFPRRGVLGVGSLADIVAYPEDPFTADIDRLADMTPAFTIVGGRAMFDPDGRLSPRP